MTANDLVLTQCYLDAKAELLKVADSMRAGDLKAMEAAWGRIAYIRKQAGYRYLDIVFKDLPVIV